MPKIICVGRNYAEHAKELNNAVPTSPVIFLKPDSAILQKNKPFFIPDFSKDIHYECELLVRIKKVGKSIDPKFAPKYYDDIGLGIDFTARDIQSELKRKGLPWELAKGFDGSAAIGAWFNKNQFNLANTSFQLQLNNKIVQQGNTKDMIFNINEIIAYISQYFTLKIGDIIFTGTPAGVGQVNIGDQLVGLLEQQEAFRFYCK